MDIVRGCGLTDKEVKTVLDENPKLLLEKIR
jgi:hypothetical protein